MQTSITFKRELSWLLTGLALSMMAGLFLDWRALVPMLFLFGYAVWLLTRLRGMVDWLQGGAIPAKAPETIGLTNRIVELVHREKSYSRKQKLRYRATLKQFKSLADELPDATIVLDAQRQIRWANPASHSILNIHPERDRGQRIDNLVRNPELHQFLRAPDADAEIEVTGLGAADRTLSVRNVPSGRNMSILIARDVTQRVRVREMRKAFVGDVSHELRTPLTVIEGYLEMLREESDLPVEIAGALNSMATQSDRMRHIVDHLLELSKLEGNPLDDDEGDAVTVGLLLESLVAALSANYPEHHLKLNADSGLSLLGSEGEIYSAFQNLIINAIKYTKPGSHIDVFWQVGSTGRPTLSVTDDGPGIESRHLSRLSERFYRVDPGRSRESGGTGLGLAITKHAAQRHGGQLLIASTPGEGSCFTIEFPAGRAIVTPRAANG